MKDYVSNDVETAARLAADDADDDRRAEALADAIQDQAWEGADMECPNDDCPDRADDGTRARWNSGHTPATRYEPADCRHPECRACGTPGAPL